MCDLDYGYMGFAQNINKIKGQTYQNLLSETKSLGKFVYDESTGEYTLTNPDTGLWNAMYISYTRPIQEGEKLLIRVNIVKNTIATTNDSPLKITFSNFSSSTNGFINVDSNFTGLLEYYCDSATVKDNDNKNIGISTRNYISGELVVKDIQVIPVSENPLGSTELPTSINGIESVAERESNVLQIAQSSYETDGIELPNGVKNSIENGVHIQRVGYVKLSDLTWIKTTTATEYHQYLCNDIRRKPNASNSDMLSNYQTLPNTDYNRDGYLKPTVPTGSSPNGIQIQFPLTSNINTLEKFKEYLINGNYYLYFELATPITEPITTTEIPLPQPLRSLPNGVCDEVVGNKLIQRVGKMIVDGTNNISISAVREKTIRFFIKGSTIKNAISSELPFLSDSLPKTGAIWNYDIEGIYQDSNGNRFVISILKSKLSGTTVNDVKNYFTANPMALYYELVTPVEHTINVNIKKIKKSKCLNKIKPTII